MDKADLGAMVGRQTPLLALVVPLVLVGMIDGGRGIRQVWPAAALGGVAFAIGQFVTSNYISVELTDIVASLISIGVIVLFLRVWQPAERVVAVDDQEADEAPGAAAEGMPAYGGDERQPEGRAADDVVDEPRRVWEAYAPYAIIILIFALAQIGPIKDALGSVTGEPAWPGLEITNDAGEPVTTTYTIAYLMSPGTLLLVAGVMTLLVLRVPLAGAVAAYVRTLRQLAWAIVTVAAVLALAFVMNHSGQTITLGKSAAGAGAVFALLSPIIGWLGVAVTGSDTSSNALFGGLRVSAAQARTSTRPSWRRRTTPAACSAR